MGGLRQGWSVEASNDKYKHLSTGQNDVKLLRNYSWDWRHYETFNIMYSIMINNLQEINIYYVRLTWAKGVTMKSSPVCLRETELQEWEKAIFPLKTFHIHALSPSHSFSLSFFMNLTLHWRGRSYVRPSWATCRSRSLNGRGRTLFSGSGERRCVGWGLDSANPAEYDLVIRHFPLHNFSMREGEKVWWSERTEI